MSFMEDIIDGMPHSFLVRHGTGLRVEYICVHYVEKL